MNKNQDTKNELDETDSSSNSIDNISKENSNLTKEENNIDTQLNDNKNSDKNKSLLSKIKDNISSTNLILCLIFLQLFTSKYTTIPQWEYKTVYLDAKEITEYIDNKLNSTKIELSADMINEYGSEGWELVDTYLEIETVHPNYGNNDYVTGLQPNVRPQRLVLIFKKPL